MTHLKSRRLTYYNFDKQQTQTRVFSLIEIAQANSVFDTIEDILLENDLTIRNKYVSEGRCACETHNDTYFMIEVDSDLLEISLIHDIEDALEALQVKFIDIIARHERRHTFLQLVVIQQQHQQPLSIENP